MSAPGIVHNFLWYTLKAEINALSFGFDYHILTKINNISIQAKSVLLVTDMPNFSEKSLQQVKTKLRNFCERYCNFKVPHQQRQITRRLSQRNGIVIMKTKVGV